jgi:hypothetical protein
MLERRATSIRLTPWRPNQFILSKSRSRGPATPPVHRTLDSERRLPILVRGGARVWPRSPMLERGGCRAAMRGGQPVRQILVYADSLTWGIIPGTRRRLPFQNRWPGLMELTLIASGHEVRVIEDCLNGRRTAWDDPFKPGRNGLVGIEQRAGKIVRRLRPTEDR